MKKSKLFISFFLALTIALVSVYNLKLEKTYTYNTNEIKKQVKYTISSKEEASLTGLKSETGTYTFSDKVYSDETFDTIFFKLPKKGDLETYGYKVKLKILVGDKVYYPEISDDGDDRVILSDTVSFTPLALGKSINSFSYFLEFNDKSLLVDNLSITTLDTKSFSYHLALNSSKTEADEIGIIKRNEWGAVEDYRYADSKYWKAYYDKLASQTGVLLTEDQKAQIEKTKKINEYLKTNFPTDYETIEQIDSENGHPLVRPIEKTRYVRSIVIHHTASEDLTKPSDELLRGIYYYHSIQNGRGDVGYHYIVGQDGKIYEGKAGGDYVLGSHVLRNNRSTVSISVIGNYQNNYLTEEQQASINKLVGYLTKKYGIDLDKETTYHKSCLTDTKCSNPLIDVKGASLIGHRDSGYTTCPGDNIYNLISNFKESNSYLSSGNKLVLNSPSMKVYEQNKIKLASVGVDLVSTQNIGISEGQTQGTAPTSEGNSTNSFDKKNNIKIKLSYPENQNTISLKFGDKIYDLEMKDGKLYKDGVLINDKFHIGTGTGIVEITSWSRIPAWDTAKKYNDNKFRGIITIYAKSGKLVVVNELSINDYMKGIAEISNDALPEKAKTILVSARSYARWYISKDNRKFPGEYYDGSDDPNVFQKYLGYSMEQRNPNIVKLVEATIDEVITYNGKLIKPWYFNQSNGKTLSYFEYCLKNNPNSKSFCSDGQTKNYPYLVGVDDQAGVGKTTLGHGVGLSGDGATYFAKLGRDYKKIIKYYYTGVEVAKLETATYSNIVDIPKNTQNNNSGTTNLTVQTNQTKTGTISTGTIISKIFTDVDSKNTYYTAIKYFKDKGSLAGFSDGSFKPDNSITRIEALKILLSSFGYKKIDNKSSVFSDISTKTWENAYLQRAILLSLIDTKNKTFSPSRNISKIEMLKMIILLKKVNIESYKTKLYSIKDVKKTDWFYPYIVYGIEKKLFTLESGYIYPTKSLSRGELVNIMYKLK